MQKTNAAITVLNEQEYYRKVYGGWLGKNIGGTLGAPLEGRMELLDLTFYSKLPEGPLENDDLDLQLVWLHALEQYGARLTAKELGQEWVEHVFFPFDEYGYALTNLRRGLLPPVSGSFGNPFANCMGSPIRSEIWAMVAPAAPGVAAYYAYQDAIVDHAGGEGVYGEMFFSAIQSAAFVESDRSRLIDIGLSFIPPSCRTAKAVKDLLEWHAQGKTWVEARELILDAHGNDNFTDAPQNIAFTILGWLYGEDFGDAILKAVNCGFDTDCTGATLGAILGIIDGPDRLPEQWVKPVGDRIVVSPAVKGFPAPADLDELTSRTMVAAKEVLAVWNTGVSIAPADATAIASTQGALGDAYDPRYLWEQPVTGNRYLLPQGSVRAEGLELTLDYGAEGPSIGRGGEKTIAARLTNRSREPWVGELAVAVPTGWTGPGERSYELAPGQTLEWDITVKADDRVLPSYELTLAINRLHNGHLWQTKKVTFSLVAASQWTVEGPACEKRAVVCSGNRIDFSEVAPSGERGIYRASATVSIPSGRELRLIVATTQPVKALWNGEAVIDSQKTTVFMPAYHRAPESQIVHLTVPAGEHHLDIEVEKTDERPLDVYVLPVAQYTQIVPGSYFYFTDILFV